MGIILTCFKRLHFPMRARGKGSCCYPSGICKDCPQILLKNQGAQVHIGAQYAKIADGFLLAYGDIEVNCSFEALLEASLEQVKDALSRELFA